MWSDSQAAAYSKSCRSSSVGERGGRNPVSAQKNKQGGKPPVALPTLIPYLPHLASQCGAGQLLGASVGGSVFIPQLPPASDRVSSKLTAPGLWVWMAFPNNRGDQKTDNQPFSQLLPVFFFFPLLDSNESAPGIWNSQGSMKARRYN